MKTLRNRNTLAVALSATILFLSACNSEPESMNVGTNDPMAAELANAAPLAPLPMIKASRTYRCKDNSLAVLDFMTDDVTANFRTAKDAPMTPLKAPEAGKPYVSADGKTTVEGQGPAITVNGTSCKTG